MRAIDWYILFSPLLLLAFGVAVTWSWKRSSRIYRQTHLQAGAGE